MYNLKSFPHLREFINSWIYKYIDKLGLKTIIRNNDDTFIMPQETFGDVINAIHASYISNRIPPMDDDIEIPSITDINKILLSARRTQKDYTDFILMDKPLVIYPFIRELNYDIIHYWEMEELMDSFIQISRNRLLKNGQIAYFPQFIMDAYRRYKIEEAALVYPRSNDSKIKNLWLDPELETIKFQNQVRRIENYYKNNHNFDLGYHNDDKYLDKIDSVTTMDDINEPMEIISEDVKPLKISLIDNNPNNPKRIKNA